MILSTMKKPIIPKLQFGGGHETSNKPKIINHENVPESTKNGVVELYNNLAPSKALSPDVVKAVQTAYPEFGTIDVTMILEKAFHAFEQTVGRTKVEKIRQYFGIGQKKSNKGIKPKEIENIIVELRTMENAQYYIAGYSKLISMMARKIGGAPASCPEIVKAKLCKLFLGIISGIHYFPEDYVYSNYQTRETRVNYNLVMENDRRLFLPEEMFVLSLAKLPFVEDEGLFYSVFMEELEALDQRLQNQLLEFAEMELVGGELVSINKAPPYKTFGSVRRLKVSGFHKESSCVQMEVFFEKGKMASMDLGVLYFIYKVLKRYGIEDLPVVQAQCKFLDGKNVIDGNTQRYAIAEEIHIAGPVERRRYLRLMEFVAEQALMMPVKLENKLPEKIDAQLFMAAIRYLEKDGKITNESDAAEDVKAALQVIAIDKSDVLRSFYHGKKKFEEAKEALDPDEEILLKRKFEQAAMNYPQYERAIIDFAASQGYIEKENGIPEGLISNVFLPHRGENSTEMSFMLENAESLSDYICGKITASELEKRIGFNPDFAEMFFDYAKVDIDKIKAALLEEKKESFRKKQMDRKFRVLVWYYCYLVENQIPCGPKKRPVKGDKGLKPANLKAFVE